MLYFMLLGHTKAYLEFSVAPYMLLLMDMSWWLLVYLFGVLRRFQHCTGHITTGSWKGRGNQYIEFARVVYCKLPTNGKQLPAFPLTAMTGIDPRPQRWEARVLPLCHRGPLDGFWVRAYLQHVPVLKSSLAWSRKGLFGYFLLLHNSYY